MAGFDPRGRQRPRNVRLDGDALDLRLVHAADADEGWVDILTLREGETNKLKLDAEGKPVLTRLRGAVVVEF